MNVSNLYSIILMDHAYASTKNDIEEEPGKLPKCEVFIKTEGVEIKIEEPDSYEGEKEHLHFEPCDTTFYNPDAAHDNADIEFMNHTSFETKSTSRLFHGSQDRETNRGSLEKSKSTSKLIQENKKLKKTITNLRREKRKCSTNIERKSKEFYRDLDKMHITQSALEKEIKSLKEENEQYKTRLLCYEKLKKHHFDMETQILELRRQAHRFMKYEKMSLENIKSLEMDKDAKSNETKALKKRLTATVKSLSLLKMNFTNLLNTYKKKALRAAECAELKEKLKSAEKMTKVYEVLLSSSKMQFEKKIREKQRDLDIAKAETDSLTKMVRAKIATCNILEVKYKFSIGQQMQKIQASHEEVASAKQQITQFSNLLSQKTLENDDLRNTIHKLEKDLLDIKKKDCNYCRL
nr:spindle assembly checkpoint component MAD1-like [Leptinotarsa decemlineata]